jgi:hypothetical protein
VPTTIGHDPLRTEIVASAIEFAIDELRGAAAIERRRCKESLTQLRCLDPELGAYKRGDVLVLPAALRGRHVECERYERLLLELDATS